MTTKPAAKRPSRRRKAAEPVEKHDLIDDGAVAVADGVEAGWDTAAPTFVGGCSCGAQPQGVADMTPEDVKDWHERHIGES